MGTFFVGRMVGGAITISDLPHVDGMCSVGLSGRGRIECTITGGTRDAFTKPWFEIIRPGRDYLAYMEDNAHHASVLAAGQITVMETTPSGELRLQADNISGYLDTRWHQARTKSVFTQALGAPSQGVMHGSSVDGVTLTDFPDRTLHSWAADAINTLAVRSRFTYNSVAYDLAVPIFYLRRLWSIYDNQFRCSYASTDTGTYPYPSLGADGVTVQDRLEALNAWKASYGVVPTLVGQSEANLTPAGVPTFSNTPDTWAAGTNGVLTSVLDATNPLAATESEYVCRVTWTGASGTGAVLFQQDGYYDFMIPGFKYTVGAWVKSTVARTIRIGVEPYNQDTATALSDVYGSNASLSAGVWTWVSRTITAPANASLFRVVLSASSATQFTTSDTLHVTGWTTVLGAEDFGSFSSLTPSADGVEYLPADGKRESSSMSTSARRVLTTQNPAASRALRWEMYTYDYAWTLNTAHLSLWWEPGCGWELDGAIRTDAWANLAHRPKKATPYDPTSYLLLSALDPESLGGWGGGPLREDRYAWSGIIEDADDANAVIVRYGQSPLRTPETVYTLKLPRKNGPISPAAYLPGMLLRLRVRDHPVLSMWSKGGTGEFGEYIDTRIMSITVDDSSLVYTIEAVEIEPLTTLTKA